jgi:hypothetical protein
MSRKGDLLNPRFGSVRNSALGVLDLKADSQMPMVSLEMM